MRNVVFMQLKQSLDQLCTESLKYVLCPTDMGELSKDY